ncbi:MAG: hypothetical protein K9G71_09905 [Rhodobacteraceae bacterium]|nr:hypothetical protein [Paracoccaceae bacterium]MCF8518910.1 hypothetical protein [Paracoccaceae bacterium]
MSAAGSTLIWISDRPLVRMGYSVEPSWQVKAHLWGKKSDWLRDDP